MNLNKWQFLPIFIFVLFAIGVSTQAHSEETPHLAFVKEYIRELAAMENARTNSERKISESNSPKDQLLNCIHTSTVIQLELRSQVNMLKSMQLNPPFETIIPTLINLYEKKIEFHQDLIDISSTFIAGPKKDVDYGKLVAELPKIRACLDEIDHTIFISTPLVFATLIDQKPDSKNHLSHLIITKEEREKLINDITTAFGKKLEQKDQKYIVASASVLKSYLLKGFKCSDEPWN